MKHEDIGSLNGGDQLIAQIEDDLCAEAAEKLLEESFSIFLQSTIDLDRVDDCQDGLREVLKNAYKKWDVLKTE